VIFSFKDVSVYLYICFYISYEPSAALVFISEAIQSHNEYFNLCKLKIN
jgi:hypothetical protein